nr:hypothetical protein [Vibrio ostreicida]
MPQVYCCCCQKVTSHKVVMKRCPQKSESIMKGLVCFFATLVQGAHYVKMEKQTFCRTCNTQSKWVKPRRLPNVKTA